jgi:hypothetical protein
MTPLPSPLPSLSLSPLSPLEEITINFLKLGN